MKKKKRTPAHWRQFLVISVILVVLLLSGIAWIVIRATNSPSAMAYAEEQHAIHEEAYENAIRLWESHNLNDYRYNINTGSRNDCVVEITIEEAVVIQQSLVNEEDCYSGLVDVDYAISTIFSEIKAMLDRKHCGANGCICDGYQIFRVEYDETYGFPMFKPICVHAILIG
ncbi:MAG: DUF6174 domain-containing protein [Chloroflexota bacterium]